MSTDYLVAAVQAGHSCIAQFQNQRTAQSQPRYYGL